MFEHLGTTPIDLESTRVIQAPGVTHLTFRVVKERRRALLADIRLKAEARGAAAPYNHPGDPSAGNEGT